MLSNSFYSLIVIILSSVVGTVASLCVFKGLKFELGRGKYIGAFPFLFSLFGIYFFLIDRSQNIYFTQFVLIAFFLSITGFFRDYYRISYAKVVPFELLLLILPAHVVFAQTGNAALAYLWLPLIVFCLRLASLVYEMPAILASISSLPFLIHAIQNDSVQVMGIYACLSMIVFSIVQLILSAFNRRYILGASGLNVMGLVLGIIALGNPKFLIFSLLIPSMVILFPFILICAMIVIPFFGNKLHAVKETRDYSWSLGREQVVVFTGLIFLCLNFMVLLVQLNALTYGYIALFLLLIASLISFFKAFARKLILDEKEQSKSIKILDIEIFSGKQLETIERIKNYLRISNEQRLFHVVTADSLAIFRANKDVRFRTIIDTASLVVPDGAGLLWAADFLGSPLKERIPGVKLVQDLCVVAAKEEWKVFFIGGRPGVAKAAADKIKNVSPNILISGIEHGYFNQNSEDEEKIIQTIVKNQPDILFVALGVPRQEEFIIKLKPFLKNSVVIGVGGSFDVISGAIPRAPEFMQKVGLEWLFRLYKEPFRFMRILQIPQFVLLVLRHKWNN